MWVIWSTDDSLAIYAETSFINYFFHQNQLFLPSYSGCDFNHIPVVLFKIYCGCVQKKNTVIVPKPTGLKILKYYKTGTNMMHFTDEICENLNSYNGLFLHIMPWPKIKGFSTTDIWSVSTDHIRDSHSLSRGDRAAAHTWILTPLAGHCSLCCSRSEGRAAGRNPLESGLIFNVSLILHACTVCKLKQRLMKVCKLKNKNNKPYYTTRL